MEKNREHLQAVYSLRDFTHFGGEKERVQLHPTVAVTPGKYSNSPYFAKRISTWDAKQSEQQASALAIPADFHKSLCDSSDRLHQLYLDTTEAQTLNSHLESRTSALDPHESTGKSFKSSISFDIKPVSNITIDLRSHLQTVSETSQPAKSGIEESSSRIISDLIDSSQERRGNGLFTSLTIVDSSTSSEESTHLAAPKFTNGFEENLEFKDSVTDIGTKFSNLEDRSKGANTKESKARSYTNSTELRWPGDKMSMVKHFSEMKPKKVAEICEIMQLISPPLSPIPSENDGTTTNSIQSCKVSRAIDTSPNVLQNKLKLTQIPLSLILPDTTSCTTEGISSTYTEAQIDVPPKRSALPDSSNEIEMINCQNMLSQASLNVILGGKYIPMRENQSGLQTEMVHVNPRERFVRTRKPRNFLRLNEGMESFTADGGVQVNQNQKTNLRILPVYDVEQAQPDMWDAAAESHSVADSFSHTAVENYGDCARAPHLDQQEPRFQDHIRLRQTLKSQTHNRKSVGIRRKPKRFEEKYSEEINLELNSGAPFLVGKLIRSSTADESHNVPTEASLTFASGRWEDCINKLCAKCRQNSTLGHPRSVPGQKRATQNPSSNETHNSQQEKNSSLMRHTFSSVQRYKDNPKNSRRTFFCNY